MFLFVQGQDVYSISVLPDDGITNPQCEPQIAFLNFLEVSNPFKSQMCPDTQLNCKSCVGLQMDSSDTYSPCTVDMDIEKGSLETPKSNEETMGSLKTEGVLTVSPIHSSNLDSLLKNLSPYIGRHYVLATFGCCLCISDVSLLLPMFLILHIMFLLDG